MDEQKAAKEKKPIQLLRERCGGMSESLKAYYKEQNVLRKQLRELLGSGERTIPELAADTKVDSTKITWHVMALRKYGQVVETSQRGDYLCYRLKESSNGR